jgi:hypothetical protein
MDALLFNWIAGLMFARSIAVNKFNHREFHFCHDFETDVDAAQSAQAK